MGALSAASEGQYRGRTDTYDHMHQPGAQVIFHFPLLKVVHCQRWGSFSTFGKINCTVKKIFLQSFAFFIQK
jgi:hypothetical protein